MNSGKAHCYICTVVKYCASIELKVKKEICRIDEVWRQIGTQPATSSAYLSSHMTARECDRYCSKERKED